MDSTRVQAKFITKQLRIISDGRLIASLVINGQFEGFHPSRYAVPDVPLTIPCSIGVTGLNAIVNQLLNQEDDVNFDFLIRDELLRVSLEEHLVAKSIGTEEIIEIEYVEHLPAPSPGESLLHDDWISSVRASGMLILTGSYDCNARIWSTSGQMKTVVAGHKAAVKSVAWLQNDDNSSVKQFVTASDDGTAMMWSWNELTGATNCLHVCEMPQLTANSKHFARAKNVESVAVNTDRTLFATGSWDCVVNIWSAVPSSESTESNNIIEEETSSKGKKKRKVESTKGSLRVPVRTLEGEQGHSHTVSCVTWLDDATVCSASWDHSIKLWDVHTAQQTTCLVGNKVFHDVSYSQLSQTLVSASADRHIRLYDPRTAGASVVKCTYTSHTGWVSSVDWSPIDEHHFVSGSYDKLFKLWDVRSPKAPLYDMSGHEDNILCTDWSVSRFMISGGVDRHLRIFEKTV